MSPGAVIDPERMGFRIRASLKPTREVPHRDPAVRKALSAALSGLSRGDRTNTSRVLAAIGEWTAANVAESAESPGDPSGWRSAATAIVDHQGHPWERMRVLVALARAAGIPAGESFNGVPVALAWGCSGTGRKTGAWTVWDPLHPSGSFSRLPVLWLPLGAEEVVPVAVAPVLRPCRPVLDGRRYMTLADATRAYDAVRSTGAFPDPVADPVSADAAGWWEVWSIGGRFDDGPPGRCTVTVPLPYVRELEFGGHDRAVWISDRSQLRSVSLPLSRTDQELGGVRMSLAIRLGPARVSATAVAPGA
jgi:hypothetical protein